MSFNSKLQIELTSAQHEVIVSAIADVIAESAIQNWTWERLVCLADEAGIFDGGEGDSIQVAAFLLREANGRGSRGIIGRAFLALFDHSATELSGLEQIFDSHIRRQHIPFVAAARVLASALENQRKKG